MAAGLALALMVFAAASPSAAEQRAVPPISRLGTAPTLYSDGDPQVLRTRDGVTLVVWNEYSNAPNHVRLARKVGTQSFQRVSIPQGDLVDISTPFLIEDRVDDRVILATNAATGVTGGLGTYIWTSATNGRTWTGPRMVWDNLGSGNLTPDGSGGFYAVSDSTQVSVIHVPSSLAEQHWPNNDIALSDRISSRGAVDLATIGQHNTLLFAFADNQQQAWVHVSNMPGTEKDVRVMRGLYADGSLKIAADRIGGVAVAIREIRTASGSLFRLFAVAFQIDSGALVLRKLRPISSPSENVVNFGVTTLKTPTGGATGRFQIDWLNDVKQLRTSQTSGSSDPVWGTPRTVVSFPAKGYAYPSAPALDGSWTAMHAYTSDNHEVEIAVPLG